MHTCTCSYNKEECIIYQLHNYTDHRNLQYSTSCITQEHAEGVPQVSGTPFEFHQVATKKIYQASSHGQQTDSIYT